MLFGYAEVDAFLHSAVQSSIEDWISNGVGPLEVRIPVGQSLADLKERALDFVAQAIEWPEASLRACISTGR